MSTTHQMYLIILKNENNKRMKTFTRLFPVEIGGVDLGESEIIQIIDSEFNEPLRLQQCPTWLIDIQKHSPFDYPEDHWYHNQTTCATRIRA